MAAVEELPYTKQQEVHNNSVTSTEAANGTENHEADHREMTSGAAMEETKDERVASVRKQLIGRSIHPS